MCEVSEEMKKYTTKPIDFTGCHPVIAEHLKRGEMVRCEVCDRVRGGKSEAWICRYIRNSAYPYRSHHGVFWKNAEPIPVKVEIKRIMPPERAIPVLIAEGWVFGDSGDMVGPGNSVVTLMFKLMGKPLSDPKTSGWVWPPCIIEEVEDDE